MNRLTRVLILISTLFIVGIAGVAPVHALQANEPSGSSKNNAKSKTDQKSGNEQSGGFSSGSDDTINDPALTSNDCNKDSCSVIGNYINPFISVLTAIVGVAITAGIIYGAIEVSSSGGDPNRAASGKNHIRNAIFAAIAYALLFGFIKFIIPGGIG